jgi:RND family efflux transporter MFP subunit
LDPADVAVARTAVVDAGPVLSGTLAPVREAVLRAELGGRVVAVGPEPGARVRAGELLVQVAAPSAGANAASAAAAVRSAATAVRAAEQEARRLEALRAAGAVATREVETAMGAAEQARAQLAEARARAAAVAAEAGQTRLVAPFAGVIGARTVNRGEVVQAGGDVATVLDPSRMRLEAGVPVDAVAAVRPGTPVRFQVVGYPGRRFVGEITRVYPAVDPVTRLVRVTATLPNTSEALVAGVLAEGRVLEVRRRATVIPADAVVDDAGDAVDGDAASTARPARPDGTGPIRATEAPSARAVRLRAGRLEGVTLRLGVRTSEGTVEVLAGVAPGDTLLVGGARAVPTGGRAEVGAPRATGMDRRPGAGAQTHARLAARGGVAPGREGRP